VGWLMQLMTCCAREAFRWSGTGTGAQGRYWPKDCRGSEQVLTGCKGPVCMGGCWRAAGATGRGGGASRRVPAVWHSLPFLSI